MIDVVAEVFEKLYTRFTDQKINVFLCGAKTSDNTSIRDLAESKLSQQTKLNIVYPEWLFANLMREGQHDLLSLEKDLAKNVDIIVLPLEGYGSICELGAFASNDELVERLFVLNDQVHKRKRTFINDGPIRLINRNAEGNVVYYDSHDKDSAVTAIENRLRFFKKPRVDQSVANLFNLSRFLGLLIAVIQPVRKTELSTLVLSWDTDIPYEYFDPAIEILSKRGHIRSQKRDGKESLSLTKDGHKYNVEQVSEYLRTSRWISSVRSSMIWRRSRTRKKFDRDKEEVRLLD